MTSQPQGAVAPGLLLHLVTGAGLGAAVLILFLAAGLERPAEALGAQAFRDSVLAGDGFFAAVVGGALVTPLSVVGIAVIVARGAQAGVGIPARTVALTAFFGAVIFWFNLGLGLLAASAVIGVDATPSAFSEVAGTVAGAWAAMVLAAVPLAGLAALASRAVGGAHPGRRTPTTPLAGLVAAPRDEGQGERGHEAAAREAPAATTPSGTGLVDHPLVCPRCHSRFTVSGARPLHVACPSCGKSGVIR